MTDTTNATDATNATKEAETPEDPCPQGMFEWSAFGANYSDTYCQDGLLFDADSNTGGEISCPFCDPIGFADYEFADSETIPTCSKCETKLPNHTPLTFHDGHGLRMTAKCPGCGEQDMLWRVYDFDTPGFVPWESAPRPDDLHVPTTAAEPAPATREG